MPSPSNPTKGSVRDLGSAIKDAASSLNQTHIDWQSRLSDAMRASKLLRKYVTDIQQAYKPEGGDK